MEQGTIPSPRPPITPSGRRCIWLCNLFKSFKRNHHDDESTANVQTSQFSISACFPNRNPQSSSSGNHRVLTKKQSFHIPLSSASSVAATSKCSSPANSVVSDDGEDEEPILGAWSPAQSPCKAFRQMFVGLNDEELQAARTMGSLQLDEALQDSSFRKHLVDSLLVMHSNCVVKVRCICAVNEVLRTVNRGERSYKAARVVDAFIRDKARYLVRPLPDECLRDMLHGRLIGFVAASNYLARELMMDVIVAGVLERTTDELILT